MELSRLFLSLFLLFDRVSPGTTDALPQPSTYPAILDFTLVRLAHLQVEPVLGRMHGRAEIRNGDQWGQICEDGWGAEENTVFCGMMGLNPGDDSDMDVKEGPGPIYASGLDCIGSETSLADCPTGYTPGTPVTTACTSTINGDSNRHVHISCTIPDTFWHHRNLENPEGGKFDSDSPDGRWQLDTCQTVNEKCMTPRSISACDDENLKLHCPRGVIHVTDANYGRLVASDNSDMSTCPAADITGEDTNCRHAGSLQLVQDECDGRQTCTMNATSLDDPCPGTDKMLTADHYCQFMYIKDLDECAQAGFCDPATTDRCENTPGYYECHCKLGATRMDDKITCEVDECRTGNGGCAHHCNNSIGSYSCSCEDGYSLIAGRACQWNEVDECSEGTHDCNSTSESCVDTYLSFRCVCKTGWEGTAGSCTDINECDEGSHNCGSNAGCTNNEGGFACACNGGFEDGSSVTGVQCVDVDECANVTSCDQNAECFNSPGTFKCQCNKGWSGTGKGENSCTDINECDEGSHNCGSNAGCTNNEGSFTCECETGYKASATGCDNIDECTEGTHNCDSEATCQDTPGGFSCSCNTGFTGNGTKCQDIDECSGINNCHPNATCVNNDGSYVCQCNEGFEGNGNDCTNIKGCSQGNHNCHSHATCSDVATGGFTCSCNQGWTGDGLTCKDIDECDLGLDNCQHVCTNSEGSYDCSCNTGFSLVKGIHCEQDPTVVIIFFQYSGEFPPALLQIGSPVRDEAINRLETRVVQRSRRLSLHQGVRKGFTFSAGSIQVQLQLGFPTTLNVEEESRVISEIGDLLTTTPVQIVDTVQEQTVSETPMYNTGQGNAASTPITSNDVCFLFKARQHCQHGSVCDITDDNVPYCKCSAGYSGEQCEEKEEEEESDGLGTVQVALISSFCVLAILGLGFCFFFFWFLGARSTPDQHRRDQVYPQQRGGHSPFPRAVQGAENRQPLGGLGPRSSFQRPYYARPYGTPGSGNSKRFSFFQGFL